MIVKVIVKESFIKRGKLRHPGEEIKLDLETAANLMRVGTVERDEAVVEEIKKVWESRADFLFKKGREL